ncbi:Flavin-dependent oxidoreductase, luciferase family (includes alkanesulfonate monooxygenase SsuD and methylene tetrahydromethanopterin reductase) [Streptomyces sp. 2224.1]|uniref:LLM class flavin-dependent oxidoreductase n=1 Tax=unclassified Streptomyces TaxID=2593676 RepID=UPI00088A785D|nr:MULTISPECIES: LLM class flavin-dependent oxidoreductase [unclassified Streptomyces]PBC86622.1 alkanesulfonate monooxygenase SsuD/methylene tetrahydromethanopterin reductase-like flavin-dependent oxidoreductase (luciferase family) [Streptomyces sp. 2321.6]SDQ78009.1 Flavin-dependent oxidoreductase, luciferase family (includes alkanesulfonate monooxygenase SsuD and methylene tetrahydromethanopterin reductase) [Streptomyces sp. KS_16]SED55306.1 Flavin-dependent oxidoreductase, luciferase family 
MRISILFPVMPTDPRSVVPFAELVRAGQAARLWQGQSLSADTHQVFAYLAGMGYHIPIGTSVVLMPLRHAMDAAIQSRSLALLTGQRMVLGLGPGTPDFVTGLHGKPYDSPRDACVAYLKEVRRLLGTEGSPRAGDGNPGAVSLPAMAHPGVETGLGVLRPVLARAAGQVADVAISWMTPPGYVRDTLLPAMAKGAAETGRPVPRMVTVVHAAVDRPHRNPYRLAYTAARAHLAGPHYTDMLRRAGLRVHHSRPSLGARALVDSGTFAHGSPEDIAEQLAEYGRAGVDEVVVNVAGVYSEHGHPDAVRDLHDILAACREQEQVPEHGRAEAPPGRMQGGDAPRCPTTSLAG